MDIAKRFDENPIVTPDMVRPSRDNLTVECVLNPGAFRFQGKTWLLMRVSERQVQREGYVGTAVADETAPGGLRLIEYRLDDPALELRGACVFTYAGKPYLTTLSHLRLASSKDGIRFEIDGDPALAAEGPLECYGIEDCRVARIGDDYLLTFTEVSDVAIGVGLAQTQDWKTFRQYGMIIPPDNKDCAIFPAKVRDEYYCLHRPDSGFGGPSMWIAKSPDLSHWGAHTCVARTRPGRWDENRLGAGAAPIKTERGWLEIYHGVSEAKGYCLGALLLDLDDPTKVIARSEDPIMEPTMEYEQEGFVNSVIFTNGHVVDGDTVTVYYGASDRVICGAYLSIRKILDSLGL